MPGKSWWLIYLSFLNKHCKYYTFKLFLTHWYEAISHKTFSRHQVPYPMLNMILVSSLKAAILAAQNPWKSKALFLKHIQKTIEFLPQRFHFHYDPMTCPLFPKLNYFTFTQIKRESLGCKLVNTREAIAFPKLNLLTRFARSEH